LKQGTSSSVLSQWGDVRKPLVSGAVRAQTAAHSDFIFQRNASGDGCAEKRLEIIFLPMNLDEAQRKKVAGWIEEGLKLSEIQNRIGSEFGVRLTYMDVRFLVDDLKLVPKDPEIPKAAEPSLASPAGNEAAPKTSPANPSPADAIPATPGGVSVSVDQLARPGTLASGKVTFSDGNRADWHFDQTGRLGLLPQQATYRPPAADLQQFQILLEAELSKMGF